MVEALTQNGQKERHDNDRRVRNIPVQNNSSSNPGIHTKRKWVFRVYLVSDRFLTPQILPKPTTTETVENVYRFPSLVKQKRGGVVSCLIQAISEQ